MSYGKTTAYYRIAELTERLRVIQGGTSGGKTIAIIILLLEYATKNPGKLITIAAANYPHLRRGAMRDFKNILDENNLWSYYKIEQNKAESTFRLYNGATIEFVALNEFTARGARRDVLFVNEANLISFEAFQQLEIRTKEFIFIDYNPTSEFWAHTELIQKRDDTDFIICTYKDNEALDENIIKAIEQRKDNKNWWRVYGLGEIGELEGLIYSGWQMVTEIPDSAELLGYGLDFGYTNDPTAIVAVYKQGENLILDEICYQAGMFNDDISKVIKEANLDKVLGVGDSSEPKSIDEIARAGCTIKGATKTSQDKSKTYNQWAISKIQ
ncbi:phage terminase large subunit, partial [Candidatus Saccharibacteria bacterium]|nr:phage terminase large subunit [Candidatus Saccharibacteria bacterium]